MYLSELYGGQLGASRELLGLLAGASALHSKLPALLEAPGTGQGSAVRLRLLGFELEEITLTLAAGYDTMMA